MRSRAARARARQLHLLAWLETLDSACTAHMQHGAMAGNDPLTDSVLQQLECAAVEGAQQPAARSTTSSPRRSAAQFGWWLSGGTLLAALVSVALLLPGGAA